MVLNRVLVEEIKEQTTILLHNLDTTIQTCNLGFVLCEMPNKINQYLDTLSDEMLYEKPNGCNYTRLALVLGQYRHLNCHLGNINCTTIIETGEWPRVLD